MKPKPTVVVVVPCFNEGESLPHFFKEVNRELKQLKNKYQLQLLFVNDGSTDNTQKIIGHLCNRHQQVFYINFAANFGHQSALRAGLAASSHADAVIMLDADLQHPPAYFGKILELWEQGYQIVQMVREDSLKKLGPLKFLTSKSYYAIINRLSGLSLESGASDFRLVDGSIIRSLSSSPEQKIFLRAYFSWIPSKRITLSYKPAKRAKGESKYTYKKMLKLGTEGVMRFSEKPLLLTMALGLVIATFSFLYGLYIIIAKLAGSQTVSGWASLMTIVLFFFGMNFVFLGVLGAYIAQNNRIVKSRPEYVIVDHKLPPVARGKK